MNIIGLDPGADGGMAIITPDHKLTVHRFLNCTVHDIRRLFFEESLEPCTAFIEKVHGLPGCGGQFEFGKKAGWLEMACAAFHIPYEQVAPQGWQRGVGVAGLKLSKPERKKAYRAKAQQLFPTVNIHLAIADAVLIAEYGWRRVYGRTQ